MRDEKGSGHLQRGHLSQLIRPHQLRMDHHRPQILIRKLRFNGGDRTDQLIGCGIPVAMR